MADSAAPHVALAGLVGHHDDGDGAAPRPALLQHRDEGDVVAAEDPRDLGEDSRPVHRHDPQVVRRADLVHRTQRQRMPARRGEVAVFITGDNVGNLMFYGRGAGQLPTASAIWSDTLDIARRVAHGVPALDGDLPSTSRHPLPLRPMDEIRSAYYLRVMAMDRPGVLAQVAGILGGHDISLVSVLQKGRARSVPPRRHDDPRGPRARHARGAVHHRRPPRRQGTRPP